MSKKVVHKYPLSEGFYNSKSMVLTLPRGASILAFQIQHGEATIWASHYVEETKTEDREFVMIGTGWQLESHHEYIGTVQEGDYVWHLFERY